VANFADIHNIERTININGMANNNDIVVISFSQVKNKPGIAAKITNCFSGINIIELAQVYGKTTTHMSFLIKQKDYEQVQQGLKEAKIKFSASPNLCAITLFDFAMKDDCNYVIRVTKALSQKNINIEFISSSGEKIVVGVIEKHLKKACQALAEEFSLLK